MEISSVISPLWELSLVGTEMTCRRSHLFLGAACVLDGLLRTHKPSPSRAISTLKLLLGPAKVFCSYLTAPQLLPLPKLTSFGLLFPSLPQVMIPKALPDKLSALVAASQGICYTKTSNRTNCSEP